MSYGISSYGADPFGLSSSILFLTEGESGALLDSHSSVTIAGSLVAESAALADQQAAMTTYFLQASEAGSLLDLWEAGTVLTATLDDAAAFSDWVASGQLFDKVQAEVAALVDSTDGVVTVAIVMVLGLARISDGPVISGSKKLMNYYILGSDVTLISAFSDINGMPVEPNEVGIEILQPDDTSVVVGNDEITNLGGGTYTFSFKPPMTGIYFYRFTGQGTTSVVAEAYFLVQRSFN